MNMDLMIDLETLATDSDAAILSIGVCWFDMKTVGDPYGWKVNLKSNLAAGRKISPETLSWWLMQEPEPRTIMSEAIVSGNDLDMALVHLAETIGPDFEGRVWSHGATFDLPILQHAYSSLGMKCPWNFWMARDTRTLSDLCPLVDRPRPAVAHDAKEDALAQAKWVREMMHDLERNGIHYPY